jgi:CheY-like chemotaxis protein
LLTYARGQALWPVAIDPVALVSETRLMFERVIGPRVAVQVSLASDTPALFADPAHLNAALVNLAVNASHAMPDGGVLTFGVHAASEGDLATVILTVADTGVGMDGMTLARAADPFFTTRGLNGTGLGLSLVKGFVEQSGGTMSIASRVGEGTRVELVLPQAKAALANARGRPIPWLPGHILVVDDNADILRTTDRILAKAGHQTETAANGLAALALLERGMRFDALVTDFVMTGLNGADLIERCRLPQPGLPSLIITGFAQVGNTLGLPADVEVLRKPFQGVQLLQMVQSLMARQSVDAKSDKNS